MRVSKAVTILIIMALTLLSGCNQPNNQKESIIQPVMENKTNNENTISDNEAVLDQNKEAQYFPTDNPKYKKIGNARFNFWIDIPAEWKAFDKSVNGDGYFVVSDNGNIDIRTYGGLNAINSEDYINAVKGDSGKVSDFVFRNNTVGRQVFKSDSEINFTCLLPDRHIDFYINYEKDKDWFSKNKDTIIYIAKSLRSGDWKSSEKEMITDIKSWNHPVKKTLQGYNIEIDKIELSNGSTYPTFYVKLPFKVNLDNEDSTVNLLDEVASHNGYWDYEIKDETQNADIKVSCDKKSKKVNKVNINGDDNYFKNLFSKQNVKLINAITTKQDSQLEILAKGDADNDGNPEAVIKYEGKLYLIRDENSQREFIGELKDYIHVVHEVESVEIKKLDKTDKKYIVVYSYQGMNGGNGFTIYSLENNKIGLINNNFYGATAKGHSSLEDIDNNGTLDSVLRIKHYDLQKHFLAIYTNWDGSGDTHYKIEYGNDEGKFIYPLKPEEVIENYLEDYYWKKYLREEMNLITGGKDLNIADFENDFGSPSTLEYGPLYLDYKVVTDSPKRKVFYVQSKVGNGAEYYFIVELNKNWVITGISKNKP